MNRLKSRSEAHQRPPELPFDTYSDVHLAASKAAQRPHGHDPAELKKKALDRSIPSPSLFDFGDASRKAATNQQWTPPSVAECATHLVFLEALHNVRAQVLASTPISCAMGYSSTSKPDKATLAAWHHGKWKKYVEFAIVRFLSWRETIPRAHTEVIHCPPLDVLMVWQALLLNPSMLSRYFREEPIADLKFPWELVHAAVDTHTWELSLAPADRTRFEADTGMAAHLLIQFEDWPVRLRPGSKKKNMLVGLSDFEFGRATARAPQTEHDADSEREGGGDRTIPVYAQKFLDVRPQLANQLREAVLRQFRFVERMHDLLWVRSPALEGTLARAAARYDRFCELMRRVPDLMMVPTLDVDLVWHTHQCAASQYGKDMEARVGRFINHDDTVASVALENGFDRTADLYHKHFGKEYRICGCWECEALASAMEQAVKTGETDIPKITAEARESVTYYRAVESERLKSLIK
ncbi:hypothetical protein V2G26_015445 [Clonostachys chloroleuca]